MQPSTAGTLKDCGAFIPVKGHKNYLITTQTAM